MRKTAVFLSFYLCFTVSLRADEGMWIPLLLEQLNQSEMQEMGLRLSAEDIYAINKSSLKDAVVHFGGGCTSEIISTKGLLLTNHHCGYSQIQSHSSVESDYLTDGFWAKKWSDELPNSGLTATFIVRIEDVTPSILNGVTEEMDEKQRQEKIDANILKTGAEAVEGTPYDAVIKPFYHGNEFYMIVTQTYKDIRLVAAPPSSIGKYGGDTDNWMWPRHTGDFSIFRIYADKDNQPAEYSEDNVPYRPKHHFPISLKGVEENDFTMIYGFPGRTSQYLTSYAVDYVINTSNPAKIKMRETSLALMDQDMKKNDKVRIQYAAKYARISNYHKKWIGETRGLKRLKAIEKKQKLENEFLQKSNQNQADKEKYGGLINAFEQTYQQLAPYAFAREYFIELIYYGPEILRYANRYQSLVQQSSSGNATDDEIAEEIAKLKKSATSFFKNYNYSTDKKVFAALMELYYSNVDKEMHPEVLLDMQKKFKGDFEKYSDWLYEKSILSTPEKASAFLEKPKIKKLEKDPAFLLMKGLYEQYATKINPEFARLSTRSDSLSRIYMDGLRTLLTDRKYYPDANSTLRLGYGKVEGFSPADGVVYSHYTTLKGLMEKENPQSDEFRVPEKLKSLYKAKDYGEYASKEGEMWVCFTASNHTTGGNSGSPVLNADGHLIGLNFDRAWESTMSDIMFDPERCRNIMVDVRYILFILDKFAGMNRLIEEMTLITADNMEKPVQKTEMN